MPASATRKRVLFAPSGPGFFRRQMTWQRAVVALIVLVIIVQLLSTVLPKLSPGRFLSEMTDAQAERIGLQPTHTCLIPATLGRPTVDYKLCLDSPKLQARLRKNACVVYSFGIRDEWSFDLASAALGCDVHSFDPTEDRESGDYAPNVYFHKVGIAPADGKAIMFGKEVEMWSLPSAMKRLGHSFVDVVKLDIEGGEWETLASGDATDPAWGLGDHVGQLAIDFHFGMGKYSEATASAVFQHLEDQGYQLFHRREGTKTSDYVAFRGQGMHNLQDTSWVKL